MVAATNVARPDDFHCRSDISSTASPYAITLPSLMPGNEIVKLVNSYTAVVHALRFSLLEALPNPYADSSGLTGMRSEKTRRSSTYRRLRKFLSVDLGFVENIVDEK